jgi:glycosyltransferase involved in cell wall biosynthesis
MKITHILNYSWENGGSSKVVHDMAVRQQQEGFDVCIISIDKAGHKPYLAIEGVEILLLKAHFLAKVFPLFSVELFKILKNRAFDCIHLHGIWNFSLLAVYILGISKKCILTIHGCLNPFTFKAKSFKRALFTYSFQKKCLQKINVIHVFHAKEKQYVVDYLGFEHKNIKIIPNGIDLKNTEVFDNQRFKTKNVLYLSRLDPIKGLDLLLPAFKIVLEKIPDAKLILAGPDFGMLNFVQNFIKTNNLDNSIKYVGVLTGIEKSKALNQANVFVLPSYSEGFSISVLEALNEGIPVVISEETGLSQDIVEYAAGTVTEFSEKSIAKGIIDTLQNAELALTQTENAQKMLKDRFDSVLVLNKIIALNYLFCKK